MLLTACGLFLVLRGLQESEGDEDGVVWMTDTSEEAAKRRAQVSLAACGRLAAQVWGTQAARNG